MRFYALTWQRLVAKRVGGNRTMPRVEWGVRAKEPGDKDRVRSFSTVMVKISLSIAAR